MKIFHVIPKCKNGGVESAVFSSVDYLLDKGYDFRVISLEKNNSSIPNKVICLENGILNPITYLRFVRLVLREKPDLIVFSLWKSALIGIVAKCALAFSSCNFKTALLIHNTKYAHFMDSIITKISLRIYDDIYFDSLVTKKLFKEREGVNGEVISFITRKLTKKNFDLTLEKLRFVFVGRLHNVKNIDLTIKFLSILKELGANVNYDIYGPDEGVLEALLQKINKLGMESEIHYRGEISNSCVPTVLKNYDFYIQFSQYEGMAMSVVEAMQVGLIPVVTNVGEIRHYAENKHNAFILKPLMIQNNSYLVDKAKEMLAFIQNRDMCELLHFNASKSFDGQKTYAEDFAEKVIEKNNLTF